MTILAIESYNYQPVRDRETDWETLSKLGQDCAARKCRAGTQILTAELLPILLSYPPHLCLLSLHLPSLLLDHKNY